MVVCGILALSIIIANFTIIIVILRNPRFPTSQLIYKLSLGFADILVGIFVVPSFIITLYLLHVRSYQKETKIIDCFKDKNKNLTVSVSTSTFNQNADIYFQPEIPSTYYNFFGFITSFSLSNSVFTLMFASIDRFLSLSNPLRYKRDKATLNAKRFTLGLYFVSFVFSMLPIVAPKLGPYQVAHGGVAISFEDQTQAHIKALLTPIPFLVMWIFTISILIKLKRQKRLEKKQIPRQLKCNFTTEKQLSKTLTIMIAIFTLCILPKIIVIVLRQFFPFLKTQNNKKLLVQPAALFSTFEMATSIIFASNSLWNAFIYTFRNKQFRRDAAALFYVKTLVLRF